MARFRRPAFVTNLRSYFQHFGRGILLLIGVLAIVALVIATFVFGNERREEVTQPGDDGGVVTTEVEENGTAVTTEEATGDPATEDAGTGSAGEATGAAADAEQPDEIANTGGALEYSLAATAMALLALAYRRASHDLKIAQVRN